MLTIGIIANTFAAILNLSAYMVTGSAVSLVLGMVCLSLVFILAAIYD